MRLIVLPSESAANTRIGPRPERDSRKSVGVSSRITLRPSKCAARRRSAHPFDRAGRQMVEQVDDPGQAELLELLGDLRPNALQRLDLGEQRVEDLGAHAAVIARSEATKQSIAAGLLRCARNDGKTPLSACHAVRPRTEAPRLARAPSRHARGRHADRRVLRRSSRSSGTSRSARCSMRCSASRTPTSWPGRSEPPSRPSASPARWSRRCRSSITSGSPNERAAAARPRAPIEPLTLAGVPSGFLPWLAADLARAAFGSGKGARGGDRRRRSGDARARRHRAVVRARTSRC